MLLELQEAEETGSVKVSFGTTACHGVCVRLENLRGYFGSCMIKVVFDREHTTIEQHTTAHAKTEAPAELRVAVSITLRLVVKL